jgi:hypothetical protein
VVADTHHFDEAQDPDLDPHQSEKSVPDPNNSKNLGPDLHLSEKKYIDLHQGDADQQHCSTVNVLSDPLLPKTRRKRSPL